jgi:hypothetical protein
MVLTGFRTGNFNRVARLLEWLDGILFLEAHESPPEGEASNYKLFSSPRFVAGTLNF